MRDAQLLFQSDFWTSPNASLIYNTFFSIIDIDDRGFFCPF